jgi:hypothetical protein
VRRLGSQASSKLAYLGSYIKCSERELLPVSGQSKRHVPATVRITSAQRQQLGPVIGQTPVRNLAEPAIQRELITHAARSVLALAPVVN